MTRRQEKYLSMMIGKQLKEELRKEAEEEGLNLSCYIRRILMKRNEKWQPKKRKTPVGFDDQRDQ